MNNIVINADQPGQLSTATSTATLPNIWAAVSTKASGWAKIRSIPNMRGIRNDVVARCARINIPVLRWPGGCFADEYHWKDGIGPREERPSMVNTHWGGVVENNHFGTHEFMDLCEQLDCEPYICGNVGSGTVQEMQQWVEYLTFDGKSPMADLRRANGRDEPWKMKYFGVGNENWGCGGNMTAEYYANEYRRFDTYRARILRQLTALSHRLWRQRGRLPLDRSVDEAAPAGRMDGLALHYYTLPAAIGGDKGRATQFDEDQWIEFVQRALHGRTHHAPQHDHGQVRPAKRASA